MSVIDRDQAPIKLDEPRKALFDDATEAAKAFVEGDTPKSADDFNLSDSDVRLVEEAMSYFMRQTAPLTEISKHRAQESRS